ncbi:MAG: peptidyl-prolyl cis-trans isomerase, partial [Alphaproteobacteria bacterium]
GEEMLALGRIFLPITPGMPETALVALEESAARVSDQATNCPDMQRLGREAGSRADPEPAIVRPDDLPPGLLEIIAPLPANRATPPIRLEDGFLVAMVCERRSGSDAGLPSRDEVMQSLGMQRIDMMARRYLRDLRRAAFVDVRL